MITFVRHALAATVMAAALASAPTAAVARDIGKVAELQGSATAARSGARMRDLAQADPVFFKDILRTGASSRLSAELDDGTRITLGDEASLVVDDFVYKSGGALGRLVARVRGGPFLLTGGRIEDAPRSRIEVRTPLAVLGVRGTTVWGGPIDGAYGVFVVAGQVDVRTAQGVVRLAAGQGTTLRPRRPPDPAVVWGADKVRRAIESVTIRR